MTDHERQHASRPALRGPTGAVRGFPGTVAMGAAQRFVDVDGCRTSYLERGTGEPVVLVHGSGRGVTAAANWFANIEPLSERFRVLAPELVGFGDTDPSQDGTYGITEWATHLIAFLDVVGIDTAHLVGNSLGGWVACHVAQVARERVGRLVLMGTGGTPESTPRRPRRAGGSPPTKEQMREALERFVHDPAHVDEALLDHRVEYARRPGGEDVFAATLAARDRDRVERTLTPDIAATIAHDTLLVHGREDRIIPVESSWSLLRALPNAHLVVFSHCGHWTQIEHARRFNLLVDDHLRYGVSG